MATIAGAAAQRKKDYALLDQYFDSKQKSGSTVKSSPTLAPPGGGYTSQRKRSSSSMSSVLGIPRSKVKQQTAQAKVQAKATQNIFSVSSVTQKRRNNVGAPSSTKYIKGDPLAGQKALFEAAYGSSKTTGFQRANAPKKRPVVSTVAKSFSRPVVKTPTLKASPMSVGVSEIKSNRNIPVNVKSSYSRSVVSKPKVNHPEAVKKFLNKMSR